MSLTFYGLTEKPFNATPDPRFLYMSPAHREALAQLRYGVQERKGFIVLTGKVGTGKTTLVQALRQRLDGQTAIAFVAHSTLPFDGILEYALEDLGVAKGGESRAQRLIAFSTFLNERERAGQNTVLILDEAQNLAATTLEEVRLLSNFETPTTKLLQILLVGQPELRATLEVPELAQLKQRIGLHCHLSPLTPDETREYIRTRLRVAGARDLGLFDDGAVDRIVEYSGGTPRLINLVCDHSLLFGYVDQKARIDRSTIAQAIEYLEGGPRPTRLRRERRGFPTRRLARWAFGAVGLALASVAVGLALRFETTVLPAARWIRDLLVQ